MDLAVLKDLFRSQGDNRPKYLFNSVDKEATRNYSYIFWFDLMGAKNLMKLSLPRAARTIMKIHTAAILSQSRNGMESRFLP